MDWTMEFLPVEAVVVAASVIGLLLWWAHRYLADKVPILMYHRISNEGKHRNIMPRADFEKQMDYLARAGFQTVGLSQLAEMKWRNRTPSQGKLPPKPVVLSFDDGYRDNLENALPILRRYGMKGIVFVAVNSVGDYPSWLSRDDKSAGPLMNWDELRNWVAGGMEVGSHTMSHCFLSALPDEEIRQELAESKKSLEEKLGITVEYLCYPYGDFDQRVARIAAEAGYKGALGIFQETDCWNPEAYGLPRIGISYPQPLWEYALKVSSLHVLMIWSRQGEKKVKKWWRRKK